MVIAQLSPQAVAEAGVDVGIEELCQEFEPCREYFIRNHPDYEKKLYGGPSLRKGVAYQISADRDVPEPYTSSMAKGAYYSVIICEDGEYATNDNRTVAPYCQMGARPLGHGTDQAKAHVMKSTDYVKEDVKQLNFNATTGKATTQANISTFDVPATECSVRSSNAPDIFYHGYLRTVDGVRLYDVPGIHLITKDSCGNPIPAPVSDGYAKFYQDYLWDNFDWTEGASALFGRAVLAVPVWLKSGHPSVYKCIITKETNCAKDVEGMPGDQVKYSLNSADVDKLKPVSDYWLVDTLPSQVNFKGFACENLPNKADGTSGSWDGYQENDPATFECVWEYNATKHEVRWHVPKQMAKDPAPVYTAVISATIKPDLKDNGNEADAQVWNYIRVDWPSLCDTGDYDEKLACVPTPGCLNDDGTIKTDCAPPHQDICYPDRGYDHCDDTQTKEPCYQPDNTNGSDRTICDVVIRLLPKPSIWKTVDKTEAKPGGILTYTLHVTNKDAARSTRPFKLIDQLPDGVTYQTAKLNQNNSGVLSYDKKTKSLLWQVPVMKPNTNWTVTLTVKIDKDFEGELTNYIRTICEDGSDSCAPVSPKGGGDCKPTGYDHCDEDKSIELCYNPENKDSGLLACDVTTAVLPDEVNKPDKPKSPVPPISAVPDLPPTGITVSLILLFAALLLLGYALRRRALARPNRKIHKG
jgi:uncharacterized repeat protein (TIGR01451 family)